MFNPVDDMINWKSLIDIKNYDDSYKGDKIRPFCDWTSEQITNFNKKLNLEKSLDKNKAIEAIKDIIDFGLPYQDNFFSNYQEYNYYYKMGLEKLIPSTDKESKNLDKIIYDLENENEEKEKRFNNCLSGKNKYKKIKTFILEVYDLCESDYYKNKKEDDIKEWAKECKEFYKNNPNSDDIEKEEDEEVKKDENNIENIIEKKISNINQKEIDEQMKIKGNESNKKGENLFKMNKSEFAKKRAMFETSNKNQKTVKNTYMQKPLKKQKQPQEKNKVEQKTNQENKPFNSKEILAHIIIGFKLIFKIDLRYTQLISLYILIHKKKNLGRIIQVMTGEGKTCIIIGLAIYHVLKNHKVDIVTSNNSLAIRDSESQKNIDIYKLFNIKISNCISKENEEEKKCYDKSIDIVYGDTHNFQADFLQENYYSKNIKQGRGEDIIIVDEIDSMLVDEYAKSTLLADKKPYMESLTPILYFLYYFLKKLVGTKKQIYTKEEQEELSDKLIEFGKKIINGYKENNEEIPPIPLPSYLKEYALNELKIWARNAIFAFNSVSEESYIKRQDKIIPVDNENTGVVQYKSSLSSGLHQFL